MKSHSAVAASLAVTVAASVADAASATGSSAARAQTTIKLGTLAPDGSPWHRIIRDMADSWKAAAGGALEFRIYAGGTIGDEAAMVRKMRVGQLQAASLTGEGLSDIVPEVQALQMPMLLKDYAELDYVLERVAPQFEALLDAKGFKVVHWGDAGWVRYFSKETVVRPADLRKRKLFVWAGDTNYIDAYKDAGMKTVPLPVTEMHTALQSGLVDAFPATPLSALSFQWFGQAKHMTDLDWAPLVGATVLTTKAWESLPADVRSKFMEAGKKAGERLRDETRKLGRDAIETMKKHGLVVDAVPPEALEEWETAARAAYPKLQRLVPAAMVQEVERIRDEYRAGR